MYYINLTNCTKLESFKIDTVSSSRWRERDQLDIWTYSQRTIGKVASVRMEIHDYCKPIFKFLKLPF